MDKPRKFPTINSSSMADIAFLLLIFFLVTTMFSVDYGLLYQLPPKLPEREVVPIPEREMLSVLINSADDLMVEGERVASPRELTALVKEHILNQGTNPTLSSEPRKALVSIKADRGTTYAAYLAVLDAVDLAYNEIYASRLGLTLTDFLAMDPGGSEVARAMYFKVKEEIPKQVSFAEPSQVPQ